MEQTPRIGCVPYLNAKPLLYWFNAEEGKGSAEVVLAAPTELAKLLSDDKVDVALASSFYALDKLGLFVADAVGISSQGAVESVRMFSKVPFQQIESLALDVSSLTSNHLAQILLAEKYGCAPTLETMAPDINAMLQSADACLLIGDAGLEANSNGLHVLDLGAAWNQMTGLPFVWALWIGKSNLTSRLADTLRAARDFGVTHVEDVAMQESQRLGIAYQRCLRYLAEVIDFELSETHWAGFSEYARLCKKHGFLVSTELPKRI